MKPRSIVPNMLAYVMLASLLLSLAVVGCSKKEPTTPPEPAKTGTAAPAAVKPEAPPAMPMPPMPEARAVADIVDTAVADGSFNTLVAAIKAAGLVGTLKGSGHSPYSRRRMRPLPSSRPGPLRPSCCLRARTS